MNRLPFSTHAQRALRMWVACALLITGFATFSAGCRGTAFVDRADAPSGDPNAGDYHLAGVIQDAGGKPINGVTLTILSTIRYYGKSGDGGVPFYFTGDSKEARTVDGTFSVEAFNAIGVSLLFEKDGFAPVRADFATYEEQGAPVIHKNLRIILRNTNPSTHEGTTR